MGLEADGTCHLLEQLKLKLSWLHLAALGEVSYAVTAQQWTECLTHDGCGSLESGPAYPRDPTFNSMGSLGCGGCVGG